MLECQAVRGPYDGLEFLLSIAAPECWLICDEHSNFLHWKANIAPVEGWVRYVYAGVRVPHPTNPHSTGQYIYTTPDYDYHPVNNPVQPVPHEHA